MHRDLFHFGEIEWLRVAANLLGWLLAIAFVIAARGGGLGCIHAGKVAAGERHGGKHQAYQRRDYRSERHLLLAQQFFSQHRAAGTTSR